MDQMRIEQHHMLPKMPRSTKKRDFVLSNHKDVIAHGLEDRRNKSSEQLNEEVRSQLMDQRMRHE